MARKPTTPVEADAPDTTAADPAARLKEFDIDDDTIGKIIDELGVETLDDLAKLNEADLVMVGLKPIPARNLLDALAPPAPVATDTATLGAATLDILPTALDDISWLEALRTGGVLKVDPSTVISTVRAALADRVQLYDVPKRLAAAMERFAEMSEEPVDPEFFRLRKQLTQRNYAEIFEAIEGLDGNYVTDGRRKELLDRMSSHFWPAITGFNSQLQAWQQLWMQGMANPGMLMIALASGSAGIGAMPPGLMQPPDTGVLRDQADEVNNALNRVFAGVGVPIAAALAYDATQIRKTLENPRLPTMIGAANRDQMLKQLDVGVSAIYPRLETNLTRFVLGTLQLKDVPAGNEELQYLAALFTLGTQIQWDQLGYGSTKLSGIGDRL